MTTSKLGEVVYFFCEASEIDGYRRHALLEIKIDHDDVGISPRRYGSLSAGNSRVDSKGMRGTTTCIRLCITECCAVAPWCGITHVLVQTIIDEITTIGHSSRRRAGVSTSIDAQFIAGCGRTRNNDRSR